MTLTRLAVLALLGWSAPAGPDPSALVEALSSPREAEREEAAGELEEAGRAALPALYKARETAAPDLRRRVSFLADLIERQRLTRATRVVLDFDDRPLPEVVDSLRTQTGFPVVLGPDGSLRDRRLTLRDAKPVPFWEALGRLPSACGVRYNPGAPPSPETLQPVVTLVPAEGPPAPTDTVGPFRVDVVRIGRQRDVVPARPPGKARVSDQFTADLQVFAEPGLTVGMNGPPVVTEATDDRGQDLRPRVPPAASYRPGYPARYDTSLPVVLAYRLALRLPDDPGRRVRKLKGFLPVTVVARTEDTAAVPLAGSEGKAFSCGGVTLTVNRVERVGANMVVSVSLKGAPVAPPYRAGAYSIPLGDFEPPYRIADHARFVDDKGRSYRWHTSLQRNGPDGSQECQLNVAARKGDDRPTELRYDGLVGVATEIAFEFSDLPLP